MWIRAIRQRDVRSKASGVFPLAFILLNGIAGRRVLESVLGVGGWLVRIDEGGFELRIASLRRTGMLIGCYVSAGLLALFQARLYLVRGESANGRFNLISWRRNRAGFWLGCFG